MCVYECLSGAAHQPTLSAVVGPKARVVLLVREVRDKQQAEGVPGGGDDLGSRHSLRVC